MKNQLPLFVATLTTLFITLTASAQGEWKWAHYWSGTDGLSNAYYNTITNTAFDEDGNFYVYGSMGGTPVYDGINLQFVNNAQVLNNGERSILLAKFDTSGNMLWYKVVKSSAEMAYPLWMEVRDNKVHIAGNCAFYGSYSDDWLYYLDTLVYKYELNNIPEEQQELPFKPYHRWTFFAQLDLDGNLLEDHFVETYSRDSHFNGIDSIRRNMPLCMPAISPVHIGNDGSVFVYTFIQYKGYEDQPYTIVVDGDSNKTYNLYLPGNANASIEINNVMLYKFSSNYELDFAKPLIIETDGIAPVAGYPEGDYVKYLFYPYLQGMSFDENDNMFVSGYFQLAQCIPGFGGELNQYPVHLWWDSTHCATINDVSSAEYCNFIIKYNTDGSPLWSNQIFTTKNNNDDGYARVEWYGNALYDNSTYVLGNAGYDENSLIYFDDGEHLEQFQGIHSNTCFFAKYNAITGEYINHGIVPAENVTGSRTPAVVKNRVFAFSRCNNTLEYWLSTWQDNGQFISVENSAHSSDLIKMNQSLGVYANENGNIIVSLLATSPVTFGNNLHVNCPSGQSSAVFALYHNPEFTQPFVPDDSVGIEEYYQNREREIYLYPNPTDGRVTVCGYMYGYRSIELLDLQGRKLATLMDSPHGTDVPKIDLSPYPSGTYLVKINFERGVSVVRKVVKQ